MRNSFLFLCITCCFLIKTQILHAQKSDSLYLQSKNKKLNIAERLQLINKAIENEKKDSLILKYTSYKTSILSQSKNYTEAIFYANELLKEAKRYTDTAFIGKSYYKLGLYNEWLHNYGVAYQNYFKASQFYQSIDDSLNSSKSIYNLALLNYYNGNFYQSEKQAVHALRLTPSNQSSIKYKLCAQLALSSKELLDYENMQYWCHKALDYATTPIEKSLIFNSLGLKSQYEGNHKGAMDYFDQALGYENIDTLNILRIQSNKSLSSGFLNRSTATKELKKIASQRLELGDLIGSYASNIQLTRLLIHEQKTNEARTFAEQAYELANKINSAEAKKESLGYIIDLNVKDDSYLKQYKILVDSISKSKVKLQSTFDKTEFQTQEKEKENLQLKADKAAQSAELAIESKRKWQLGGGLGAAIAGIGILGFYYNRNKKQKETIENLQKELHHRVKNNLTIIDTFVEMTKDEFPEEQITTKLTELQNRIDSINSVHEQLYIKDNIISINLKKYVAQLAANVSNSFTEHNIQINKDVDESIELAAEKSFSLGLLINEFLTNSFKYAFEEKSGKVNISINEKGNFYHVLLSDNGKGLPEGFDINTSSGFGLRLIKSLTNQLNGSIEVKNENGLCLLLNIPKS